MRLWVIVPALNEARGIEATLRALQSLRVEHPDTRVIVVDGRSSDDTVRRARALADDVITTSPGRARQMNAGAACVARMSGGAATASSDVLLFLHADTRLPQGAAAAMRSATAAACAKGGRGGDRSRLWGRFDVRLSGAHPLLRLVEFMMNLRSRWSGIATGDQAIFVRRDTFERLGGFADIALMEDVEFSRRAKRLSRPACLSATVETSSRRWEQGGVLRTIWLMLRLRLAYFCGADPGKLAQRYRQG